jgi:hypothetical protein
MSLLSDIELAITEAWENMPPVVPTAQREPNHVARLIGHVCQPIADSIVSNGIATAASVRATFCHQNPYAFWSKPSASGGDAVVRRELGDLLIIVRSTLYERALLLQTKMSGPNAPSPWQPGVSVPVSPAGQRDLYACLHPFHLEYTSKGPQATAKEARDLGSVTALEVKYNMQGAPLQAYKLAMSATGSLPPVPPAMIFAWIDSTNTAAGRVRLGGQWSAWLTELSQPVALTTQATLSSTLAACLEGMICELTPQVGRSIDTAGPDPEWRRLVKDLEVWADTWFHSAVNTSTNDVETVGGVYDSKLYDNRASAFMAWTTAGPYAELRKLPGSNRAYRYLYERQWTRPGKQLKFIKPPSSPTGSNGDKPEGRFAVLEIRLTSPTPRKIFD